MSYNVPVGHIEFRTYDDNKPVRGYGGHLTINDWPGSHQLDLQPIVNRLEHEIMGLKTEIDIMQSVLNDYMRIKGDVANLTEKYDKLITALETMKRGDELYKLLTYTYEGGEN